MKRPTKIAAIIAVVLVVLLLAGWIVLQAVVPGIVRDQVRVAVHDNTQMEIEIGRVGLRGLSGVTLRDVRLTERDRPEIEVAYIESIVVDLAGIPWPGSDMPPVDLLHIVRPRAVVVTEPDGRLNLARLMVPDEPVEPTEPPLVIRGIRVDQADLRYVDQRVALPPPDASTAAAAPHAGPPLTAEERQLAAAHMDELSEPGWPGADLIGVDVRADMVDEAQQGYEFTVSITGGSLGSGAIAGTVVLDPFEFDLRSTDPLKPTAETLAGIPWIAEELLAELRPSAQINIERFWMSRGMSFPMADVRVTHGAFTPPGMPRIEDITMLASLTDNGNGRIILTETQTDGAIIDGEILIERLDRWDETQRAQGRINLREYQIAPGTVPGLMLNGRLDIGYQGTTPADAAGRRLARLEFVGELIGGAGTERPLRVPVAVRLAGDDAGDGFVQVDQRFSVVYAIGDAERPIALRGEALVNLQERTVSLQRTAGHVDFTTALLAQVAGVQLAQIEQLQPRGRIAISMADTVINLDDPMDSLLNLAASSQELRFLVPQTGEERRLAFNARVASVPDDPNIRYRGTVAINEVGADGALQATATMDGAGRLITGEATIADLPLPADIILALQPTLAERVQRLAGVLSGRINGVYNVETGEFSQYAGRVRLANGQATVLVTPEAAIDVGLVADVTLAPNDITAVAEVAAMDGVAQLNYRQQAERTTASLETLRGREFDLARMPAALREMIGTVLPEEGRIAIQSSAAGRTPAELLDRVPVRFQVFAARVAVPRAEEAMFLRTDLEGSSQVNVNARQATQTSLLMTRLTDLDGGLFMPQGASLLVEVDDFLFADLPQVIRATVRDWPGMTAGATLRIDDGRMLIERAAIDAQLERTDWRRMARVLQQYAPSGRVTLNGSAAREADGTWSTIDTRLNLTDVAWTVAAVRAPPLTASVTANRPRAGAPLSAHLQSDSRNYGRIDMRVAETRQGRMSIDGTLDKFIVSQQLTAALGGLIGSPALAEMQPSGIFDGRLRGELQLDPFTITGMSGNLSGDRIAGLPGGVPVERGVLRITLNNDGAVMDSFEAVAGGGSLTANGRMAFTEGLPFSGAAQFKDVDLRTVRQVRDMRTDQLSGMLRGEVAEFRGLATDAANTLRGRGEATFYDGYLWPLPLFGALQGGLQRELAGVLRAQMEPTAFRAAHVIYVIDQGRLRIRESYFDSTLMRLVMDGDILFDGRLDLHVASSLNLGVFGNGRPQIDERVERGLDLFRALPGVGGLPLATSLMHVTGTFETPQVGVDRQRRITALPRMSQNFLSRQANMADVVPHVFAQPAATDPAAQPPAEGTTPPPPAEQPPTQQPPAEQQPPPPPEETPRDRRFPELPIPLPRNLPFPFPR